MTAVYQTFNRFILFVDWGKKQLDGCLEEMNCFPSSRQ